MADVVARRNVHLPSLFAGRLGFTESVAQGYDDKELDGSAVPAAALAVARATVEFTDAWQETPTFDLQPYRREGQLVSSTGQLRWRESATGPQGGSFTMDTPGTKAVVGFAEDRSTRLGEVTITSRSPFAAIYVTAPEKAGSVATSPRLLVIALARARNTGMQFAEGEDQLLDKGRGPVLMEPVRLDLELHRPGAKHVVVLDHDGRPTGQTLPFQGQRIMLDGAVTKSPYYEVVFQEP